MSNNHPFRKAVRRAMGDRRAIHHPDRSPGRRSADREPMRGWIPAAIIGLCVAMADWGTKFLVARSIPLDELHEVIPGRLAFWHVRNPAMVLGLWENFPLGTRKAIAVVAAVLGSVVLLQILGRGHRFARRHRGWAWTFVGLVLGGMLGNLGERVVHWGVTDFISFRSGQYWLPPGNLADIALLLSMPLSVAVITFELMARGQRRPSDAPDATADGGPMEAAALPDGLSPAIAPVPASECEA